MPNLDPLLIRPSSGGTDTSGQLSANARQVIGFTVGGLALIILSRFLPTLATFLAIAIALGVSLTHSGQLAIMVTRFRDALGVDSNG